MVDWTPVIQSGLSVFAAVLPIAVVAGSGWLRSHNHKLLAEAVQTGGGVAYSALVTATRSGTVDWKDAKAAAIIAGTNAVASIAGPNADPAAFAVQVAGALGDRLASDPTVTVGSGASATVSVGPSQVALVEVGPSAS